MGEQSRMEPEVANRKIHANIGLCLGTDAGRIMAVDVYEGSIAGRAGLRSGDVILAVNGATASDPLAVVEALRHARDQVDLEVRHPEGTERLTLKAREVRAASDKQCPPSIFREVSCPPGCDQSACTQVGQFLYEQNGQCVYQWGEVVCGVIG